MSEQFLQGPLGTWTNSSEGKPDLACCRSGSAILVLQPRDRVAILGVNTIEILLEKFT